MDRIGSQPQRNHYPEVDLLKSWCARTRVVEKAHFKRCASFRRNHYIIGGVLIGASALSSALTAIVNEDDAALQEYAALILSVRLLLALLLPVCAALVTFLSYEARSAKHHDAAARFASLKRRLLRALVVAETDGNVEHARSQLEAVSHDWDRLTHDAPPLYRKHWEAEITRCERALGMSIGREEDEPLAA